MSERELNPAVPEDCEEVGFVSVLLATPQDDTTRFAYSDWLREHGWEKQADYLKYVRQHKFVAAVVARGWNGIVGPYIGRLTIPDVVYRFALYYEEHPAWGSLHIVLDDHNVEDHSVSFCIENAPDVEGSELGKLLLRMSKTQRLRLPWVCCDILSKYFPGDPRPHERVGGPKVYLRAQSYSYWRASYNRAVRERAANDNC